MSLRSLPVFVFLLLLSRPAQSQIVGQLPVVNQFGVATSVSVPDGGEIVLGGVSQSRADSVSSWGFPGNSRFGATTSSSMTSARVRIDSLEEMDRAILSQVEQTRIGMSGPQRDAAALQILRKRSGHSVPARSFNEQNSSDRSRALQILKAKR